MCAREPEKEFNRAPAVQSANSYAGCHILAEAVHRAGTTGSEKLREVLLAVKTKTVLRDFAGRAWISGRPEGSDNPVAGWEAGGGLAGRVGHRKTLVPDPAVASALIGFAIRRPPGFGLDSPA